MRHQDCSPGAASSALAVCSISPRTCGCEVGVAQDRRQRAVPEDLLQGLQTATRMTNHEAKVCRRSWDLKSSSWAASTAVSKALRTLRPDASYMVAAAGPLGQDLVDDVAHRDLTTAPALRDLQPHNVAAEVDAIPP